MEIFFIILEIIIIFFFYLFSKSNLINRKYHLLLAYKGLIISNRILELNNEI